MESIYIETTIPSYLAANPSSLLVLAGHQQMTHEWWRDRRHLYRLYSSEFVRGEAERGDSQAAKRRLSYLKDIPELPITTKIEQTASEIFGMLNLPAKAAIDASHLAVSIEHKMDYLLTWNCNHIANATLQKKLYLHCHQKGLHMPIICTPEALMEDPS